MRTSKFQGFPLHISTKSTTRDHSQRIISRGHINYQALNMAESNSITRRRKYRKRDMFSFFLSSLTIIISPFRSNAVIGYIPKGPHSLVEDREGSEMPREKVTPSPEFLQKLEEKGGRFKELEMKVIQEDMGKKVKKEEKVPEFGGLRPGISVDKESTSSKSDQLRALQERQVEYKEIIETFPSENLEKHKISVVSSAKVLPSKINKSQGIVKATQVGFFISVGTVWGRWQNKVEREKVKKGIALFETQRAEFFNVTGESESDEDIMNDLKNRKTNSTLNDSDDDDEDVPPPSSKKRPKPNNNGPSSGGGSGNIPKPGDTGRNDNSSPSDEDVDRLKRLFDK